MARLTVYNTGGNEGSGDESLPDLAPIIRRKQVLNARSPMNKIQRSRLVVEEATQESLTMAKNSSLERNTTLSEAPGDESGIKKKPKKRVLNRASNNPLLCPLESGNFNTTKSALVRHPDIEESARPRRKILLALQLRKTTAKKVLDEEDEISQDSDRLSSFIVEDSDFSEEVDSADSMPPPPRRITRRLVRGRRPEKELDESSAAEDQENEKRVPRLSQEDPFTESKRDVVDDQRAYLSLFNSSDEDSDLPERRRGMPNLNKNKTSSRPQNLPTSSGLEEPFALLSFSPSEFRLQPENDLENRPETPPQGEQKRQHRLVSPVKIPLIPLTRHRPSMDVFWNQNITNDWNDEYSPRRITKPTNRTNTDVSNFDKASISRLPEKSLQKKDRAALGVKKAFSQRKHEIAEAFLVELDKAITAGKVSEMAKSTGGIKILWSKKLNTTAGRANWKRETIKTKSDPASVIFRHHATIELAEKVIDDEDRLMNVLAHEFCHLANFMISGVMNNPHGREFKNWAATCSSVFGHRGVEVTTKHSYAIDYKYIWKCGDCETEFKRHSKSIDPKRHQCGSCKGRLTQIRPVPRELATVNSYQAFVKEHMKGVREQNPGSPQKEIMGLVGKKYQELKASKIRMAPAVIEQVVEEAGGTSPSGTVATLARNLDLIDLTSP